MKSQEQIGKEWLEKTLNRLREAIDRNDIGVTGALKQSISGKTEGLGDQLRSIVIQYLYYGKFVDQGVSRSHALGEGTASTLKGRKAKPWASKTIGKEVAILSQILISEYGNRFVNIVEDSLPEVIK